MIEVEPNNELAPTGRQTNKEVVYLLTEWGLEIGYVVLAIKSRMLMTIKQPQNCFGLVTILLIIVQILSE